MNYICLFHINDFISREKTAQEEKNKVLASAPTTIANGDALPDVHALDLLFKPQMGEMSSLGLPENLPLDFIASEYNLITMSIEILL